MHFTYAKEMAFAAAKDKVQDVVVTVSSVAGLAFVFVVLTLLTGSGLFHSL